MTEYVPYCGSAPVPGGVAWNIDPILAVVLLGTAALHLNAISGADRRTKRLVGGAGWAIVAAALISPLCNLSVALFSARVAQHMVIVLIGAPLIASATIGVQRPEQMPKILWGTGLFAVALWFWHMPGPYDTTFQSHYVYWLMHVTFFASAIWLWRSLLTGAGAQPGAVLLSAVLTTMQMSLLGAVLTFSHRALFAAHFGTTAAWGLSPLGDQQLGGLIMWVPAAFILVAYGLYALGRQMNRMEARAAIPTME